MVPTKLESSDKQNICFKLLDHFFEIKKPNFFEINTAKEKQDILVIIHPESVYLDEAGRFTGQVLSKQFRGAVTRLEIKSDNLILVAETSSHNFIQRDVVNFDINEKNIHCLSQI